jgi:hypothetical protein
MATGVIIAIPAFGLIKAISTAREAANRASCSCHLKQLGLALHTYHDMHGKFPPAYFVDSKGRKTHSWRAMLLPYVGGGDVYARYDFNEPWDGPNNRKLWDQMPSTYRCPSDDTSPPNTTSYVAIVGPTTMWPGAKSGSLATIQDGSSSTIAIVEAEKLAVPWLEPTDLDEATMSMIINDPAAAAAPSSPHPYGVMVLLADGSTRFLRNEVDPNALKAMTTRAGGENVNTDY